MKLHINTTMSLLWLTSLLLTLATSWDGGNKTAMAETSSEGPISVEVTLASSSVIQGEPIVLRYKMVSPTQENVNIHVGTRDATLDGPGADIIRAYRRDWFTMDMKDEAGQSVAVQTDFRKPQKRDAEYSSVRGLSRYNQYRSNEEYLIVNQWLTPIHPGRYVLTLHVQLSYAVLPEKEVGPEAADSAVLAADAVFRHAYQFPLVIQKPDILRLQSIAEDLRHSAAAEKNVVRQRMLIQSLFALPEDQAGASWQALADDLALFVTGREAVANALAGLHSLRAADILAAMFPTAQQDLDPNVTTTFGSRYLEEMYRTSSAPLQQYISHLYAAHGLVFPAKQARQIIPPGYAAVRQPLSE